MLDKILVEVFLPAINQSYDVYIPIDSKFFEVEVLLMSAFAELSDGYLKTSREMVVCDRITGNQLDINKSAIELGLYNGARLMLI